MPRILVVDDEERIRDIIKQYLEFEGFSSDEAEDGAGAYEKAKSQKFDLILMDIMMPNCDGITALRKIREFSDVPVILLTAKGEEYDKVFGFDLGADDYVVKPFSPRELMSRIKAILKRTQQENKKAYTFRTLEVNPKSYEIKIDGQKVTVTPKEFELLLFFIQNKNTVITRDTILNKIWGYDFYGDSRTVDTHVKMLRSNLGEYRDLIKTIWGVGYKYEENQNLGSDLKRYSAGNYLHLGFSGHSAGGLLSCTEKKGHPVQYPGNTGDDLLSSKHRRIYQEPQNHRCKKQLLHSDLGYFRNFYAQRRAGRVYKYSHG